MGEVIDMPPAFMADMVQDVQKRIEVEKKEDNFNVETIESLDGFSMYSWGFTPKLKITRNGVTSYINFKIKSVGVSALIEEYQGKMPTPPGMQKTYKAESEVARNLGQKRAVNVWEINEADPTYQAAKREHETRASQMIMLHGLCYDMKDPQGNWILKGSDVNSPSEVVNPDAALDALRRMGMSSEHFGIIVKAIRELTADEEVAQEQD